MKKQIILLMTDTTRKDMVGCYGNKKMITPNLDALAQEGIRYENAYTCQPVCGPARSAIFTGTFPHTNGMVTNGVPLGANVKTIGQRLTDNGIKCGYIGKWHLDSPYKPYVDTYNNHGKVAWNEWCPPERRHGFEHWIAYGTYDYHLKPMYWNATAPRDSFYYVNQWGPAYEADRAIEYIQAQKESKQPFALVVSMNPPHTGYELVPDRYKALYKDMDVEALCANRPDIPAKGTEMGNYFRNNRRN